MRSLRTPLILGLGLGLAGLLVVLRILLGREGESPRAAALPHRWVGPRTAVTYHLEWHGRVAVEHRGVGSFGGADGSVAMAGELALRGLGADGAAQLVGVSLAHLAEHSFLVIGTDVTADATRLEGVEVVARLAPDGRLQRVDVPPGVDDAAAHVLAALVRELTVTIPVERGDEWTVVEPGPSGRARAHYAVVPTTDGTIALARTREAYVALDALPRGTRGETHLDGRGRILLDADGALAELEDLEHLTIAASGAMPGVRGMTHFVLERSGSRALGDAERAPTGLRELATLDAAAVEHQQLERRAAGITLPGLQRDITAFALTGIALDHQDWLGPAVAFMRLHPELCDQLAAMADDPAIDDRGLAMVLDILVSTGTPEAQTAMRDVVSADRVAGDARRRANVITRFAFLDAPDPASLALLESAAHGDGVDASAARLALGSVAWHLAQHGDVAGAEELDTRLRGELAAAPAGRPRVDAILALGNARGDADRPALEAWLHDGDADERAAARTALARFDLNAKDSP